MRVKDAVLLVDDDRTFLKTASDVLSAIYDVSVASSGSEAIALLCAGYVPDIILLDIDMPDMDGFETLSALQKKEDVKDIPVVFLTSLTTNESELKGIESGAMDYIKKPFVKELLLARVRLHLDNGRRLRQLSMMEKNKLIAVVDEEKFERFADGFSDTERKMLRLIALGYTNREICESLHYAYGYVKNVVGAIYEKRNVGSRSELKRLLMR